MNERGRIIRHQLPTILREEAERLRTTADIAQGDFLIEGRDGAGRRALVPWVRFASRSRSPKATEGWNV
ncbi:MrcB family domain-containing protein, partial [Kitasatospora sp. NPDC056446]|uniref:MrcB family domain-containing protein n=1 Tax=Kitasatospora sp. NPDC056446 TaxID=3345819 RepID=UPI00367729C4